MKRLFKKSCVRLCLGLLFVVAFAASSPRAQNAAEANENIETPIKNLSELLRAKRQNGAALTLLTPNDLAKLAPADLEALTSVNPCNTALQITANDNVNGQLTAADCLLDDGSYADFYSFSGVQGQNVRLDLVSSAFDAYLGIANESGTYVREDNDGGGFGNARIHAVLPANGLYIVMANSFLPAQFGDYRLSLESSSACTYSLEPTGAQVAAEGGTYSFALFTQPNCYWGVNSNSYFLTLNGATNGRGNATISYTAAVNAGGATRTGTINAYGRTFTVTQPSITCTYVLSATGATVPATGGGGSFTITAPAGCYWSANSPDWFIWVTQSGTGTSTVNYSVQTNNGADRTGRINIAGQTFTITQPGLNCTFQVTPTSASYSRAEHYGSLQVTTQPGCAWSAMRSEFWIELQNAAGSGSGAINYRIYPNNLFNTRTGVITFFGQASQNIRITQAGFPYQTRFDFDGDSKADHAVFRRATGAWSIHNSQNWNVTNTSFGLPEDIVAPADFDGDRKTDIAVFRPSNGTWYLLSSRDNSFSAVQWGMSGDVPVAGDYDGDTKADIAVYRPSNGVWYRLNSSNNSFAAAQWGIAEDKPQVGDFDGDRKIDFAVWRPSNRVWYIFNSSDQTARAAQFGLSDDVPTVGDYDGDGKADISVYRASTGVWYRFNSSDDQFVAQAFGGGADIPVPADYDGDGKTDVAIYRPSNSAWWSMRSLLGMPAMLQHGASGDAPVPAEFGR